MKTKKLLSKALKNKDILKERNKVSIVLNKPVYTKDKARYYNEFVEEEKKQLFFD